MIQTTLIPVATATSQEMLVEITVDVCKRVCVNAGRILSGTVSFSAGTTVVTDGVAVVPIIATGTIVMTGSCEKCGGHVVHFVEKFNVPFEATGTNVSTLTPSASNRVEWVDVNCCKTTRAKLTTSLTVAIA